jgi:hypothetical protein
MVSNFLIGYYGNYAVLNILDEDDKPFYRCFGSGVAWVCGYRSGFGNRIQKAAHQKGLNIIS